MNSTTKKEKDLLINKSKKENINVSVIRQKVRDTDPALVKKSGKNEKELDELIREIEEEQRNLGVPEDKLEDRIFRRVHAVLKEPFVKPPNPEDLKEYLRYQQDSDDFDVDSEIIRYEESEKPNYSNEIFEWKSMVYLKTNSKPKKFFVNDYRNNKCFETTISYDKEKKQSSESRQELYGNLCFEKVVEFEPILPGIPRKFQFSCMTNYQKKEYTGTLDEITGQIDSDGFIYKQQRIKEVLKKAKELLQGKGAYDFSRLPPNPGFYWIDGKLESTKKYKKCEISQLRASLKSLESFVGYYKGNEHKIGYILSWILIAPFTFAMKQSKNDDLPGSLYIVGKANSGKTTVASLSIYMWRLSRTDAFLATGQIDTVARMGNAISKTTYPVIFDEGDIIFSQKKSDVAALFKSSIYESNARTVMDSNRKETIIPALSSIVFTSNHATPKDASLGRRMHTFEFSVDHPRSKEEKEKFHEAFDPEKSNGPLKKLGVIGDYMATEMIENPENIRKPWFDVVKSVWIKMYQEVGLEIPEWLENPEMPTGLEEAWESEEEKLFITFKKLVLQYDTSKAYESYDETNHKTQRQRVEEVIYGSKAPWLQYYKPQKGKDAGKLFVTVDSGILLDMEKEFGFSCELKMIAEDLKGTYGSKSINGKNRKVAYWELKAFLAMFE